MNAYPRFSQDFIGMSYCIHLFPFPVFFWTSRLSGQLLGKLWPEMNGSSISSYSQIEYKVPIFSLPPLGV